MASRDLIINYSMYVIGRVESNHTWNSVPPFDGVSNIISIGMMQNAGSHAQTLLKIIHDNYPTEWGTITSGAPRLANDVLTLPNDWNTWQNYSLYDNERLVVADVLGTDNGKRAQQTKWSDDANSMIDYALGIGFSTDYPKPLIYFMSMYHQHPQSANLVAANVGGLADLDKIHSACLNNGVLGEYVTRYTTVYDMLNAWDGTSQPPNFGQLDTPETGGQAPGNEQTPSAVGRIEAAGDTLVIYGTDGFENGLVCYRATGNTWIPAKNVNGAPPDKGGYEGGGNTESGSAVVNKYTSWQGRFYYSQSGGRLDPEATGYGDCSSTIWRAYWDVAGVDVGTWTGDMRNKGTLIASGRYGGVDESKLQQADLLLIDWGGGTAIEGDGHVEMYIGGNRLCGHGGPGMGPTIKGDMQAHISGCPYWEIRRYL